MPLGLLAFELWLPEPLAALVLANRITTTSRNVGTLFVLAGLAVGAFLGVRAVRRSDDFVCWLRPIAALFLLPPLLSPQVWRSGPLLSLALALGLSVYLAWTLIPAGPSHTANTPQVESAPSKPITVALSCLILVYAVFVSIATIRQHRLLETRAYDMGIMENVLWHTSEGRFFASSLEGRNHLGVHTSSIYLLIAPIYLLVPRPETLLVVQALLMALAAWPLFLLARSLLRSERAALLMSALYLLHPAVQGANFYDFHELAFAPLLLFAATFGLLSDRHVLLWTSTALLLLVKEDCAIIVAALAPLAFFERRARTGWILLGSAAGALLLFHGVVTPHFAGGESSFAWYYTAMIPAGEAPTGLPKTVLLNPVYSLRVALTAPKALYVAETIGSVLFLCLFSWRGAALVSYGLAISLFASREYLHQMGFQYSLQLVPEAFAGAILVLAAGTPTLQRLGISLRRSLAAMTIATAFLAFHAGMFSPVAAFRGGFRMVSERFGDAERERFREVQEVAKMIPDEASVTASETLVPHVARRTDLQTLRYAAQSFGRDYTYFFLLKTDLEPETRKRYRYVLSSPEYQLVRDGTYTELYKRVQPR